MPGRLIAIDKQPGMRIVGVGEMWQSLFAKIVMRVTGTEATMVYQDAQLCAGLKTGVHGAVHLVQAIWKENPTMND